MQADMRATPGEESIPAPTRTAWGVFSEQSGALIVGPVDDRNVAADEADRLNGEAAKVTGVVDGEVRFAVQQEGIQTSYVVGPVDVIDRDARRAALEEEVARLETERKTANAAGKAAIDAGLEPMRDELADDEAG